MSAPKPIPDPAPAPDDVLRRMLQTPPEKHAKKAKPKKPKKADK
jgi:hypothetical protein